MSVITGVLQEEKERNLSLQSKYRDEIAALPKGSVIVKRKRSGDYYCLQYRSGERVISKYLGKYSAEVQELCDKIEKRKYYENLLRTMRQELKLISKVVK
ncbi:MAG: hypothetical protein LBN00_11645 [Oscillospiraceae bacterium]|jgi:hypothetical protein|nr:hypothetical protein [Oscillospiraceae bacterium]